MPPRNLCNNLLHKFLVGIILGEFCHIFQISDGITGAVRIGKLDIFGKVVDELISPRFVFVDGLADIVIEQNQFPIDRKRRLVLSFCDLSLDLLDDFQIFVKAEKQILTISGSP